MKVFPTLTDHEIKQRVIIPLKIRSGLTISLLEKGDLREDFPLLNPAPLC